MVTVRRIDGLLAERAIDVLNTMRLDLLKLQRGLVFHSFASPADASPAAVDLPTALVMGNAIQACLNGHFANACNAATGVGVHLAADAVNQVVAPAAVDLASLVTLLNACKTAFDAHLTQAGVHGHDDTTNAVATANATDLPTSLTLANAVDPKMNAHFAAAFATQATVIVGA